MQKASASELRKAALTEGMLPMYDDGLRKGGRRRDDRRRMLRATREG